MNVLPQFGRTLENVMRLQSDTLRQARSVSRSSRGRREVEQMGGCGTADCGCEDCKNGCRCSTCMEAVDSSGVTAAMESLHRERSPDQDDPEASLAWVLSSGPDLRHAFSTNGYPGIQEREGPASITGGACVDMAIAVASRPTCVEHDRIARRNHAVCEEPFPKGPSCPLECIEIEKGFTLRCKCVGEWEILPPGKDFDPHTGQIVNVSPQDECARQGKCRRLNHNRSGCKCLCYDPATTPDPGNYHAPCFTCGMFRGPTNWRDPRYMSPEEAIALALFVWFGVSGR